MPVWNEARRAGQRSRAGAQAERSAPGDFSGALPLAKERFQKQICVYCCGTAGKRVGNLPLTGPVVFCKKHVQQYQSDKDWEAKHRREMGL